ncbi:hypothetical protein ACQ4WP_17695 [Janthinobacterium sp. GB4P2]|uniref:hypothetical protein n=1 Tax=Janthinobacterium sp. GB4P2 TaxID=3424189 RepID=UPI003F28186C
MSPFSGWQAGMHDVAFDCCFLQQHVALGELCHAFGRLRSCQASAECQDDGNEIGLLHISPIESVRKTKKPAMDKIIGRRKNSMPLAWRTGAHV